MRICYIILFILISYLVGGQSLVISPLQPSGGDTITLSYNVLPPASEASVALVYVLRIGESPIVEVIDLVAGSEKSTGKFLVSDDIDGLLITIADKDHKVVDNNDGKSYPVMIYDGGKPIKYTRLAIAEALTFYYYYLEFDEQHEFCKVFIDQEVEAYPDVAATRSYLFTYGVNARKRDDRSRIKSISGLSKKILYNKSTEKDLLMMAALLKKMNYNNDEILKVTNAKYPNGEASLRMRFKKFYDQNFEKRLKVVDEVDELLLSIDGYEEEYDELCYFMSIGYVDKRDDIKSSLRYIEKISSPEMKATRYHSLARHLSSEAKSQTQKELDTALYYCKKSIVIISKEKSEMKERKPYITKLMYKNELSFAHSNYCETYSTILYKIGKKDEALKYAKMAALIDKYNDADANAYYVELLVELDKKEECLVFLEEMIANGNATIEMKNHFKELALSSQEDVDVENTLKNIESDFQSKFQEEVLSKIIKEEKIEFSLKSLDGDKVSSEVYSGKVLVIDFWATWCRPCVDALPGMQIAEKKYSKNENVEFIYVTTVTEKDFIKEFMHTKGYDFKVLIDDKREMSKSYDVSGIPRKFVLDQSGMIRYDGKGFNGNDANLVDELSIVIEMLLGENDRVSVEP